MFNLQNTLFKQSSERDKRMDVSGQEREDKGSSGVKPGIFICFQGINCFTSFLSILIPLNKQINLEFMRKQLKSQIGSHDNRILADFTIYGDRLMKYDVDIEDDQMILVRTDTSVLESRMKSTSKAVCGVLTFWRDDRHIYYHQTLNSNVSDHRSLGSGVIIETNVPKEVISISLPDFPTEPFTTILVPELVKVLVDATRAGSYAIRIIPYVNGIYFGAINNLGTEVTFFELGNNDKIYIDPFEEKNLMLLNKTFGTSASLTKRKDTEYGVYIPLQLMKSFTKLKNVSNDLSILKLYYISTSNGGIFKMSGKISGYGEYNFYIRCTKTIPEI